MARYDYLDAEGAPVLRVLRYDPKGFRQQKRAGSRWVWGAPPVGERVLYRLPEVRAAAAAGAVVHVCEGEKDADAVVAAGATATTAPMGADKWLPQYTEQLLGAGRVLIWRDKDDAGAAHVRTVSAALTGAGIPWTVVEAAAGKDPADHLAAGMSLEQAVEVELEEPEEIEEDLAPVEARGSNGPDHEIPMGRGSWAYELGGEGRRRRGVYTYVKDAGWQWVAPLPHVHARIIQRDGSGRRIGTAYLVSAKVDDPRIVLTHEQLRTASWANALGLALSADDRVSKAATTAIIYAAENAEESEETPRVAGGKVSVPSPETLPAGYLQTSPADPETARAGWRTLIDLVARSPKMALVVGASAIAPFVAASRRKSHLVYLYGDSANGKSTTLHTAAAIWGLASVAAEDDGIRVVTAWNTSRLGPTDVMGKLGVLPPFFDEIGQAAQNGPREWGKFIFDVTEGARRITPGRNGSGPNYGLPWAGVFFAAGNGRLLEGLGAGRYAGVNRRVVELPLPLTLDRAHAEAIEAQWQVVYGHAGLELLHSHTAETVRPLLDAAAAELDAPESAVGSQIADHLISHVAGAALLDQWAGTGDTLRAAALTAAREYLQTWAEPEHDADRMLGAIRDAMGREPARWPTVTAYQVMRQPAPDPSMDIAGRDLPRHGVDRSITGIRDDEDQWVGVFTQTWREICTDLGLDSAVCARELHARGILRVSEGRRRRGEWTNQIRATGSALYQLVLPVDDEDDADADTTPPTVETSAPEPSNTPENTPVGGVGGTKPRVRARAREVSTDALEPTPIRGERPCSVCHTPAWHEIAGHPIHTGGCLPLWREDHPVIEVAEEETPSDGLSPLAEAPAHRPANAAARSERFRAPAAVLDGTSAHLPGGEVVPVGEPRHLGEVAMLAHPAALALGHGGGPERLPDEGQLWLTETTLAALGLPTTLPNENDDDKARGKALAALTTTAAVADAVAEGWQLGQAGQMREWTRIWHQERLPQGAWIVAGPWQRVDVALFEDDPHPAELADRLAEFARTLGVTYRLNPAATGIDLIDHTRPPLRPGQEPGKRLSVRKDTPAELPGWLRKVSDPRTRNVEQDWSWWRAWSALGEQERECRYVHVYDRNKAYFSSWSGVDLGVAGLRHLEGEDAVWDGSETAGYYRISLPEWGHTHLPNPGAHLGFKLGDGTFWATVHTLRMFAAHQITPQIHEVYTWEEHGRYLDIAADRLRPLVAAAEATPLTRTAKSLYTSTIGKLAEIEGNQGSHLWRPDWRQHVIALNKAMILRVLTQTGERSGRYPLLVVGNDAIGYASDEADPAAAWPGRPELLGPKPGQWKPAGRGDLQSWGPKHLVRRAGMWRFRAFDELTD